MLLKNDAAANNNKFYEIKLEDDDSVVARYGRVGATGVTEHKGHGEATFEKVKKSKTAGSKGYREVEVMVSEGGSPSTSKGGNLAEIAKRDIAKGDASLHSLLDRLTQINRFQLLAASGGQIDIVDGEVKTALGVLVPLTSIERAKKILVELNQLVDASDLGSEYVTHLQDYLTLVPQKVGHKRGWDKTFFSEFTTFQNQNDLLEQLENSVKNSKPVEIKADDAVEEVIERLFGYHLEVVEDGKEFDRINQFYTGSVNRVHVASNRKLFKIYRMVNEAKAKSFEEVANRIGNVKMLWHGTRAHNVLSILKGGLIIPPTVGGGYTIAGRMFGDGVYFSDQSTKSLNYSAGYWGSGGSEKGNIFMLNAQVAMGKEYVPRGPTQTRPAGYDSIYAIGNKSGVQNNEMIVPSVDQFRLDFLCEFE
ncbi:poly (ADP-ribose) polymerase [Xanthomonas phage Xoo-sp13]|nr:poly (ADP-ribose) polymerase [Xanthomonas phage Xoo-sp13]